MLLNFLLFCFTNCKQNNISYPYLFLDHRVMDLKLILFKIGLNFYVYCLNFVEFHLILDHLIISNSLKNIFDKMFIAHLIH